MRSVASILGTGAIVLLTGGCTDNAQPPATLGSPTPKTEMTLEQKIQEIDKADMTESQKEILKNQARLGQDRR